MRITSRLPIALAIILMAPVVTAQENDPLELLRRSAETISQAPSATAGFSAEVRIVMGEQTVENLAPFKFARGTVAAGPAFSIVSEIESDGFNVRGAGDVYTLHIPAMGKYTINRSESPLAEFSQSPMAAGLANGLGGLALSLLDSDATANLITSITSSDYLGEEEAESGPMHHCRYVIDEDLTVDVWFAAGDKPVVTRVAPDLAAMSATSPLASQHENFEYTINFRYSDWNLDAGLTSEAFRLSEPVGAELVETFMRRNEKGPHPLVGVEAPRFILETPEGEQVDLNAHLGKDVVMLDFWATWCPPCVAALPKIDRIADDYADQGVVFFAVNQDETAEEVLNFLESRDLETSVVLDNGGTAARSYRVRGLPTSVLIGKDGRVQVVHVGLGPAFEQSLSAELESLIAGDDLAAAAIAERQAIESARQARLEELKSLLDTDS